MRTSYRTALYYLVLAIIAGVSLWELTRAPRPQQAGPSPNRPRSTWISESDSLTVSSPRRVEPRVVRTSLRLQPSGKRIELIEFDHYPQSELAETIAFDSSHSAWFASSRSDKEIKIDARDLAVTEHDIPQGCTPRASAIDAEDRHWLVCMRADSLLETRPKDGRAQIHYPGSDGFMNAVVADLRTGVLWLSKPSANRIVRFDPRQEKGWKEFDLPSKDGGPGVADVDSRGALWVPQLYSNKLTRFDPSTESFAEFELPTANAFPVYSMVDRQGHVWVSEHHADKLARFTGEHFDEFPLPAKGTGVSALDEAPDGSIWFAQGGWRGTLGVNRIGRLDPRTGSIDEIELPTPGSQPIALKVGGDGSVWFLAQGTGRIGLIREREQAANARRARTEQEIRKESRQLRRNGQQATSGLL